MGSTGMLQKEEERDSEGVLRRQRDKMKKEEARTISSLC